MHEFFSVAIHNSIIVYSIFFYSIVSFNAQFSWMIYQKLLMKDKIKTNEIDK